MSSAFVPTYLTEMLREQMDRDILLFVEDVIKHFFSLPSQVTLIFILL